jgi:hypothetical protein
VSDYLTAAMSHANEKIICPNCSSEASGNFCSQCGQETHLHKETFAGLVAHFFAHYFHYDSKFWMTLKALWFSPGKLTIAYWNKQRMRYIPPISLYIFVSAVFFLVSFSVGERKEGHGIFTSKEKEAKRKRADSVKIAKYKTLPPRQLDSVLTDKRAKFTDEQRAALELVLDSLDKSRAIDAEEFAQIKTLSANGLDSVLENKHVRLSPSQRSALGQILLDSVAIQNESLSGNSAIGQYILKKKHKIESQYGRDSDIIQKKAKQAIPKVFFFMIPVLGFILKVRFFRRKDLFFVDHTIFAMHYHALWFSVWVFWYARIGGYAEVILKTAVVAAVIVYLAIALKRVYGISRIRAIISTFTIGLCYLVFLGMAYALANMLIFLML